MKLALIHDWIIDIGGAEKCLENINSIYPSSDIHTLIFKEESLVPLGIDKSKVKSSFLQKLPKIHDHYRNYLPLFPLAIEQFDLSNYDVVISSSHAVAKGVLTNSNQLHICYCYTPMRYAWDLYHQYLREAGLTKGLKGRIAQAVLHYVRMWDYTTANRVNYFIAISNVVAKRIKKIYGKDSVVIYPPVDIDKFELCSKKEDFYLTVSRMVPYKKIDLIADAFSKLPDKKLVVIGDGPEFNKVKAIAKKNVELLGYQPFEVLKEYMQKAKAFVFAAEEDFGIAPIEAQACGTPVIAYGCGGAVETVAENKTGLFFKEQTSGCLINSINEFEKNIELFNCEEIRKNAGRFSKERFKSEFKQFIESKLEEG